MNTPLNLEAKHIGHFIISPGNTLKNPLLKWILTHKLPTRTNTFSPNKLLGENGIGPTVSRGSVLFGQNPCLPKMDFQSTIIQL